MHLTDTGKTTFETAKDSKKKTKKKKKKILLLQHDVVTNQTSVSLITVTATVSRVRVQINLNIFCTRGLPEMLNGTDRPLYVKFFYSDSISSSSSSSSSWSKLFPPSTPPSRPAPALHSTSPLPSLSILSSSRKRFVSGAVFILLTTADDDGGGDEDDDEGVEEEVQEEEDVADQLQLFAVTVEPMLISGSKKFQYINIDKNVFPQVQTFILTS
ncbi:hypothetical protein ABVT39_012630 [Epinephelus coioides]